MFSISAGRKMVPLRRVVPVLFRPFQGLLTLVEERPYMATKSTSMTQPAAPNYTVPFIIVTGLFCIFGFLTNLNSNLSPKLEDIFNLSHAWSNLVTSAWFFAYLVFSVPAAKVIEKV